MDGAAVALFLQLLADQEGEFERLARIQPRVAVGVVAVLEAGFGHRARAAGAFGHVLPGHLEMHAARPGAVLAVDGEELLHLREDGAEGARLEAARGLDRIAVHRVAGPHHLGALGLHRLDQARQVRRDIARAHPADERQPARLVPGIELPEQALEMVCRQRRAAFQPERVADAAQELDMRLVRVARAVADPEHVRRAVVPLARQAVDAGQRLFPGQQQRLVRGVERGFAKLRRRLGGQAAWPR